jgi:hypothetical protein
MYTSIIRYLATAFVDAQSIIPDYQIITRLLETLNDNQLLPITVQEQSPMGVIPRIGFSSPDGRTNFILGSTRFDFFLQPQPIDIYNPDDFISFCERASSKLATTLEFFQRKSHRLALVREGNISGLSSSKTDNIARQLMNFPPTYAQGDINEWHWRAATQSKRQFGEFNESLNIITTAVRQKIYNISVQSEGVFQVSSSIPVDLIRVDFDINTLPEDSTARFGKDEILSFLENAKEWHTDLSSEFFSFMSESLE